MTFLPGVKIANAVWDYLLSSRSVVEAWLFAIGPALSFVANSITFHSFSPSNFSEIEGEDLIVMREKTKMLKRDHFTLKDMIKFGGNVWFCKIPLDNNRWQGLEISGEGKDRHTLRKGEVGGVWPGGV